jgi:hypothetical protein
MYRMRRQNLVSKPSIFRRRRWRAIGSWFVLGVFFLNALAPLGLATQGLGGHSGALDETVIVICTASGLKVIRFDDQGEPIPNGASNDGFCILCLPLYSASAITPDISQPFPQPVLLNAGLPAPIDAGLFRPAVSSGSASPRAPPASV